MHSILLSRAFPGAISVRRLRVDGLLSVYLVGAHAVVEGIGHGGIELIEDIDERFLLADRQRGAAWTRCPCVAIPVNTPSWPAFPNVALCQGPNLKHNPRWLRSGQVNP